MNVSSESLVSGRVVTYLGMLSIRHKHHLKLEGLGASLKLHYIVF